MWVDQHHIELYSEVGGKGADKVLKCTDPMPNPLGFGSFVIVVTS
jgi:hypothetical protein